MIRGFLSYNREGRGREERGYLTEGQALRAIAANLGVLSELRSTGPRGREELHVRLGDGSLLTLRDDGWELTKPGV